MIAGVNRKADASFVILHVQDARGQFSFGHTQGSRGRKTH